MCGGDNSSCSDCSGTPNGSKLNDQCGVCLLPNDPQFNACLDCAGTPNGNKKIDSCNNCLAPTDPQFNACKDCKGIQGGKHKLDQCGVCLLPTDSAVDSCLDCAGVPFGQQKPGSTCNDGNPNTSNDTRAIDCSCAGSVVEQKPQEPTPQVPTQEPPTKTPPQDTPILDTPIQELPKTNTTITLANDQTPTTPTVWQSSVPVQEKHESADTSPEVTQDDTLILLPDPPIRTSKVVRIPILTSVRQRLQTCIQDQGNIL